MAVKAKSKSHVSRRVVSKRSVFKGRSIISINDLSREEIIYILSGKGEAKVGGKTYALEPGVGIFAEPGVEHGIKTLGNEPLVLASVFSPPVKPGSYDKKK